MLPGEEEQVNQETIDIDLNQAFNGNQRAIARVAALLTLASAIFESEGHTEEVSALDEALVILWGITKTMTGVPLDVLQDAALAEAYQLGYETPATKARMN
jgi:hypothetical protein